jgi:hypothetical protein
MRKNKNWLSTRQLRSARNEMIFFCVVPLVDIGRDDARASSIRGDDTGRGKEKGNERELSHQPAVLFSHNKPATSNQPAVLFSQNKPAPAISHQPTEQAAWAAVFLHQTALISVKLYMMM